MQKIRFLDQTNKITKRTFTQKIEFWLSTILDLATILFFWGFNFWKFILYNTVQSIQNPIFRSTNKIIKLTFTQKIVNWLSALLNLAAILCFFSFIFFLEIHPPYFSSIYAKIQFPRSTNTFAASP
jgi:hypothetical protein